MGKKGSNPPPPPPPPRRCRPVPPPPPPKTVPAGRVMDLKPGESFVPLQPRSITRPYITPERKAYMFMIDWAIKVGWEQYCATYNKIGLVDCIRYESFPSIMARAYACENNIMLDGAYTALTFNPDPIGWPPGYLSYLSLADLRMKEAEALSKLKLVIAKDKKPAPTPRPSPGARMHQPDIFDWFSGLFKRKID